MRIKDSKWEMTDDYIGMKPKFKVVCSDCLLGDFFGLMGQLRLETASLTDVITTVWERIRFRIKNGDYDMFLREAFCSPLPAIGERAYHNDMHYKCCRSDGCDRVKVFGVPIDEEYYKLLMGRRKGKARVQPIEKWQEDEELRQQLENMGYL